MLFPKSFNVNSNIVLIAAKIDHAAGKWLVTDNNWYLAAGNWRLITSNKFITPEACSRGHPDVVVVEAKVLDLRYQKVTNGSQVQIMPDITNKISPC